jgi:hypothetical protein
LPVVVPVVKRRFRLIRTADRPLLFGPNRPAAGDMKPLQGPLKKQSDRKLTLNITAQNDDEREAGSVWQVEEKQDDTTENIC